MATAPRQQVQATSPEATAYFERYEAFNGGPLGPTAFTSLFTYDYTYMLVAAMQQAGTVDDTTAISEALEGIHFEGVGEDVIHFSDNHVAITGTDVCDLLGGQLTCLHLPPTAATSD